MTQPEFMFMANNMKVKQIRQGDPFTSVEIRNGIWLNHNYRRREPHHMSIELREARVMYAVPGRKEVEAIYRLHLENEHLNQVLFDWCETYLNKLEGVTTTSC